MPCEDSDQTARMRRLIWVFAGGTFNLVGNAVSLLKCVVRTHYTSSTDSVCVYAVGTRCFHRYSKKTTRYLFVCVEVLRPSQLSGVMSSAVSLPNHTFTGQAYSSKRLTIIVRILSPETDNCPS